MVKDAPVLKDIRAAWRTVRTLEGMIETSFTANIHALVPKAVGMDTVSESLLFVFAVSVLHDALRRLRDDGVIPTTADSLKGLMEASRKAELTWKDFDAVVALRRRRNEVAHDRKFLTAGECAPALAALGRELVAWGILDADEKVPCVIRSTKSS